MTDQIGALLLAAGLSRRMGGEDKLARLWRGRPLLDWALAALVGTPAARRAVVLRADRTLPPGMTRVLNPVPEAGLASSLKLGLAALGDVDAALILLGDMPEIDPALCRRLVEAWDGCAYALVPARAGAWGNPVLLSRAAIDDAMRLDGDRGARALLEARRESVTTLEVDTDAIFRDLDRPQDF
jgi:molybdenum cofactor cytidylyltransferase